MVTTVGNVAAFLNKELHVSKIKDPWSKNGLQVKTTKTVTKVALAVDACMDVFNTAKKLGCDLVVVHHGLLQPGEKVTELTKSRLNFLKKNKISLYASHLPLDKSLEYGNNSNIIRMLGMGLELKTPFSEVGYVISIKDRRGVDSIKKELDRRLDANCKVWKFGKMWVSKIAVCSGYGGGETVDGAIEIGADLLITGELSHGSYLKLKESKINAIIGGHYKTETVGVKMIGELLEEKFNLKTIFIDNPTGM
jgi:dinuclear metal center YbgI/SA1388 family protein